MRDMGYVAEELRIPKTPASNKTTPLKTFVTPEEALAIEAKDDLKKLALLCYFFSLRPQEAVAVSAKDFAAGKAAAALECCKTMEKAGLVQPPGCWS